MIVTMEGNGRYYLSDVNGKKVVSRSDGKCVFCRELTGGSAAAPVATAIADEAYTLFDGATIRRIHERLIIDK